MGQKTHPVGIRLGINKIWDSRWFAGKEFAELLQEDLTLRKYIRSRLPGAAISKIEIERAPKRVRLIIHTARPGIVIGRRGVEIDKLRDELRHLTGKEVNIDIQEIRRPELDAYLVAENIAMQIEQRISHRRAMKRVIAAAMKMGAEGIKVECAGRLVGAEMARTEYYREGRVPLQTFRADIDYASVTAHTTYGCIGVKVWICKGAIIGDSHKGKVMVKV